MFIRPSAAQSYNSVIEVAQRFLIYEYILSLRVYYKYFVHLLLVLFLHIYFLISK
jgi:hypothetical protein